MASEESLIIVGASARAAAFSALRAGLKPWCLDLFADADLRARCPVEAIPVREYPRSLPARIAAAPPGPWLYTGGLENHPAIVGRIARDRPLLGNDTEALRLARDPVFVTNLLRSACLPYAEVSLREPDDGRSWLAKPRAGAGGTGIRFWQRGKRLPRRAYFQELIAGPSCAAIFGATPAGAQLLGVTEQLVGEPWLHASRFHYCGSIGPLALTHSQRQTFQRLGDALTESCRLRGLLGFDCIWRDGEPVPVEINPRYTASIEVLEFATNSAFLAADAQREARSMVGKAILFARQALRFPNDGPWLETLRNRRPATEMPAFADIPAAGTAIKAGWPILTLFSHSESADEVRDQLQALAGELERWLYRQ
jgi:predicted ATP-grasp superfamily ATP-dependent carboligase